jgi:hypothetical protein
MTPIGSQHKDEMPGNQVCHLSLETSVTYVMKQGTFKRARHIHLDCA